VISNEGERPRSCSRATGSCSTAGRAADVARPGRGRRAAPARAGGLVRVPQRLPAHDLLGHDGGQLPHAAGDDKSEFEVAIGRFFLAPNVAPFRRRGATLAACAGSCQSRSRSPCLALLGPVFPLNSAPASGVLRRGRRGVCGRSAAAQSSCHISARCGARVYPRSRLTTRRRPPKPRPRAGRGSSDSATGTRAARRRWSGPAGPPAGPARRSAERCRRGRRRGRACSPRTGGR